MLLVLPLLGEGHSETTHALLDTAFLVTFATPLVHAWVIKPFVEARDQALFIADRLASSDTLTSLANRRKLHEMMDQRLSEAARHGEPVAVIYLDLDGFKTINDLHGHAAGDFVLASVADRMRKIVRHEDVVSRVGGDEFVVLVSRAPQDAGDAVTGVLGNARRLADELARPHIFNGVALEVPASIGVRIALAADISADQLINDADQAMYRAKADRTRKIWVHGIKEAGSSPAG